MKLFYDFFPIVIFFIVFKLYGIYAATVSAIVISVIQVVLYRIRHKKYEKLQLLTMLLIIVLGGATLILHKPIFIKWKVSVINWIFALAFLGSHFFGKKPLIRYLMEKQLKLPDRVWSKLNITWAVFFLLLGCTNWYVIYHYSTAIWVNFKLFGVLGITLAFVLGQALFLTKYMKSND